MTPQTNIEITDAAREAALKIIMEVQFHERYRQVPVWNKLNAPQNLIGTAEEIQLAINTALADKDRKIEEQSHGIIDVAHRLASAQEMNRLLLGERDTLRQQLEDKICFSDRVADHNVRLIDENNSLKTQLQSLQRADDLKG